MVHGELKDIERLDYYIKDSRFGAAYELMGVWR